MIAGYQHLEPGIFSRLQKFAVLQPSPTHVCDGENFMVRQKQPELMGKILVEKRFHRGSGAWEWWKSIRPVIVLLGSSGQFS